MSEFEIVGSNPPANTIVFNVDSATEMMRISKTGVWVNPDFPPDAVALKVLEALAVHTKSFYQQGLEAARKAVDDAGGDNCEYHMDAIRRLE